MDMSCCGYFRSFVQTSIATAVLFLLFARATQAQAPCATPAPEGASAARFERWLQTAMAQQPATRSLLTLPVIVHVIHAGEAPGTGANLSSTRIASQFDVLNEDFRRAFGTPGYNSHPAGADCGIEFCPAALDPDGYALPEAGLQRINALDAGFGNGPYNSLFIESVIKPATIWDPYRYFNIWVCEMEPGILGSATFPVDSELPGVQPPFGTDLTDGIVVSSSVFGRSGNSRRPYELGRIATHETGHWLGLRHIWGDGDCSADDYCEDTPRAAAPNYRCPGGAQGCGHLLMVENYMDYSDDACMNLFTVCQRERMRSVLARSPRRKSLSDGALCQPAQLPPIAHFGASLRSGCPGMAVSFSDRSERKPGEWTWEFPGGQPEFSNLQHPVVRYALPGLYPVRLTVQNAWGSHSVENPDFIRVAPAAEAEIFREDFEGGASGWAIQNESAAGWQRGASLSQRAGFYWMNIPWQEESGAGRRSVLTSGRIDASAYTRLSLRFDLAYRQRDAASVDSLIVLASPDDGRSWRRLWAGSGAGMSPAPMAQPFFPGDNAWCGANGLSCPLIALPAAMQSPALRLRFVGVSGGGNNLFLDNVSLLANCSETTLEKLHVQVFPNPASERIMLKCLLPGNSPALIRMFDAAGRIVWSAEDEGHKGFLETEIETGRFAPGVYLIELAQGYAKGFKKLVLRNE